MLEAVNSERVSLQLPFEITSRQLEKLRVQNGLRYARRHEATEEEVDEKREAIIRGMKENGASRYGRGLHLSTLRKHGVLCSQYHLRKLLQEIDPDGLKARDFRRARRKGRMDIAGPGRMGSLDGYDKLKPWGIEIYAFIDGYSRYVLQVYCGNDNKTAISVLVQYLRMVRRLKKMPRCLRADKGVETPLLAWAHVLLRRATYRQEEGIDIPELPFERAFSWGTSTRNIRIERWWKSLATFCLNEVRGHFQKLSRDQHFDKVRPDRIAIKYVYMRPIRRRIDEFVHTHNISPIRKQKHRGHYLPTGKPRKLFLYPKGGQHYHEKLHMPTLDWLDSLVKDHDIDSYLPDEMMDLCQSLLDKKGWTIDVMEALVINQESNHEEMYLYLREQLQRIWIGPKGTTILQELVTPLGARHVVEREISRQEDSEIYTRMTGAMFVNLNLDDDLIQPIKEDREEEVEDDEEDILYDPGEGYLDFETIEETDDEVEYGR